MMFMFFWIMFSVAVGVFASTCRNRFGFGWFLLSFIISPLLAVRILPFCDDPSVLLTGVA